MEKLAAVNQKIKAAREAIDCEINKIALEEERLLHRLEEFNDKKFEVAEAYGDVNATNYDLMEVNAGGKIIAVTRATLTHFKGTRLEALFRGRWDKKLQKDSSGRIFLDVNPLCFQAIVDYINEVKISPEESPAAPPSVDTEYQDILMHQLDLLGLSNIVFPIEIPDLIRDWLDEDSSGGNLSLLYRSSRDSSNASAFHSKCDNKGATLTVIETTEGITLGGYSDVPWGIGGGYKHSDKAFLFAVSQCGEFAPSKMTLRNVRNQHAIHSDTSYGPTFGGGFDLYVAGTCVYFSTGNTYGPAPSQLAGGCRFNIKEMEVFQIISQTKTRYKSKRSNDKSKSRKSSAIIADDIELIQGFSSGMEMAINEKWEVLSEVELEINTLEASFIDEEMFINSISSFSGKDKDIISLNVCGTPMATTRQTLQVYDDSSLISKALVPKQDKYGTSCKPVKEWNTEDVIAWLNTIDGLSPMVITAFEEDEVNSRELLDLGKDDWKDFGVTKRGTIAFLLAEVKRLGQSAILVEHSPYCFEKIIDHLRLESLYLKGLIETKPNKPKVKASEEARFEKVVKHYFPGDSSKALLGT